MCPLGTTLDLTRSGLSPKRSQRLVNAAAPPRRWWKYGLLAAIAMAACLGLPAVFLAAPIAWAIRIYALLLYPLVMLAGVLGIRLAAPLADLLGLDDRLGISEWLGISELSYLTPTVPQFAWQFALLACALALIGSVALSPRFWCRYLCPAGALMGLLSRRPFLRRKVSAACVQCGTCAKQCPMGAIGGDPYQTLHSECITCTTCVRVCPEAAVTFGHDPMLAPPTLPMNRAARRFLLTTGLTGAGYAALSLTQLGHLHGRPGPGQVIPTRLLRPPGALPEADFLTHCIRCGLCFQVCPTNTLQPLGLSIGLSGLYTPRVLPRRGACEPNCAACGEICPTDALRPLPVDEKQWAKIGTARIIPQRCLAWAQGKPCLVCDEVCPYDAVSLKRVIGQAVAVPFVDARRCSGCGYCEYHCPVKADAAIVVGPMDALRLASGSYRQQGRLQGLRLELKGGPQENGKTAQRPHGDNQRLAEDALQMEDALPPGFSD
jgi:MauM/NapG family ferredoxin protein